MLPPVEQIMSIATRRSRLPTSRESDPRRWREGFEYLSKTYRPAMVQYVSAIVRRDSRQVADRDAAEDIVQTWFASSMEKDWLVPKHGEIRSFRAFLKHTLRTLTLDELDRRFAKCRTPRRTKALDGANEPRSERDNPSEAVLDRSLMDIAFQATMRRLRADSPGYAAVVEALLASDGGPLPDLAVLAGRPGKRARDVRRGAQQLLARYFVEELRRTVHDEEELGLLLRRLDRYLP